MTPSKIFFYFCILFILGIFFESAIRIPQVFLWGILILAVLILSTRPGLVVGFCLLFLVMGVLRMQISEFNISNDKLSRFNGEDVVLTGMISGEPDVRDTWQKIKVSAEGSTILITTSKYPEYKYLDQIKIAGKLETPGESQDSSGQSYKNYLMKDHIYSVMNFPQIELVFRDRVSLRDPVSFAYDKILWFKQKIRESIRHNFLPPQSSILEGTILGDNGAMSNELKSKLNITGLRHVIAVSGTHVVILTSIIMSVLLALGLWRRQAFYIAIILICLYILLTGLPASGIRAGIMGGLYLLAQKLGRQSMGPRVITMACAAMLLINPLLLFYDVGFQLSFLAVMGLIYLEPFIKRFLNLFAKERAGNLVSIVSATFAAQIFTLPIMVYNFGNISFVSLITNLLILPVVYWLMIFGFLTSLAGVFSNILGAVLSVPCWFLLVYFVKVIDFFSQSWAMKTLQNVHWLWLAFSYLIIAFVIRFLDKKIPAANLARG